jgi:hypothetical protein
LYLDNNNIANVQEIGFTNSNLILDVDGADLKFNNLAMLIFNYEINLVTVFQK